MDTLTEDERSKLMSRIRAKDTKPEMLVRRIIFGLGYRYRLHRPDLPGRPDIVLSKSKKAIFINGCFWHLHAKCRNVRMPKSRKNYWLPKLKKNRERDKATKAKLHHLGWGTLILWECELKDLTFVENRIKEFLKY
jgi:DNA mismatch endonuclease (patch repair protein)